MGSAEGAAVGDTVGWGVGLPGKNVGEHVGNVEGGAVGLVVGFGVGLPGR